MQEVLQFLLTVVDNVEQQLVANIHSTAFDGSHNPLQMVVDTKFIHLVRL